MVTTMKIITEDPASVIPSIKESYLKDKFIILYLCHEWEGTLTSWIAMPKEGYNGQPGIFFYGNTFRNLLSREMIFSEWSYREESLIALFIRIFSEFCTSPDSGLWKKTIYVLDNENEVKTVLKNIGIYSDRLKKYIIDWRPL
jgi:hypothetical protein